MKIVELNYLANIKVTTQNCEAIIAESLELMKQASMLKLNKMQSEERSKRIKRGITYKREQRIVEAMK